MDINQTNTPVSYVQAYNICQEFQHLVGALYDEAVPGKGAITCIVPAPYDAGYQWQFAQFYLECNDPQKALRFYKGNAFMPLALAVPILRKKTAYYMDLRDYLRMRDIRLRITRDVQKHSLKNTQAGSDASQQGM